MRKSAILLVLLVMSCGGAKPDPVLTQNGDVTIDYQDVDGYLDTVLIDVYDVNEVSDEETKEDLAGEDVSELPEDVPVQPEVIPDIVDEYKDADDVDVDKDGDGDEDTPPTVVQVTVDSYPQGAEVWVDSTFYHDYTPFLVGVYAGHHTFDFSMEGYETQTLGTDVDSEHNYVFAMLQPEQPELINVTVTSSPTNVSVMVDGVHQENYVTDFEVDLLPGIHTFGFYPSVDSGYLAVEIPENISVENNHVHADLQKAYFVDIFTEPSGAEMVIDGISGFITPVYDLQLVEGDHDLSLHYAGGGYYDKDTTITVDESNTEFTITLDPIVYDVLIETVPDSAEVMIDGNSYDPTPLVVGLTHGQHQLSLHHPSDLYYDIDEMISVDAEHVSFSYNLEEIPPVEYDVTISIDPAGATVLINGNSVDTSSAVTLAEGCYDIHIELYDYNEIDDQICVGAGNTSFIFTLSLAEFTVTVSSTPAGAQLTLDSITGYITPATETLVTGVYPVLLHLDGYQDVIDTIEVHEDQTSFDFLLTPLVPVDYEVTIDSIPTGANLSIDTVPSGITPGTATLSEGPHDLVLEAAGYELTESSIYVDADNTEFTIALNALQYEVTIDSVPQGASLTVNGTSGYTTPATVMLTEGQHDLLLQYPGYNDKPETITVDADNTSFLITMEQIFHDVTISSIPSGASLTIDGTPGYTTPATESLAEGSHDLLLTLAGYQNKEVTIQVDADHTSFAYALQQVVHSVTIETVPAGANLTIDGVSGYTTPVTATLTEGLHDLFFWLAGYKNKAEQISVDAANTFFSFTLDPVVNVTVTSTPEAATVVIDDGFYSDTTPFSYELEPGNHKFDFMKSGYEFQTIWEDISTTNNTVHADLVVIEMVNVTFMTNPIGASISIDSNPTGEVTPKLMPVSAGDHTIEFTLTGYQPCVKVDENISAANNYIFCELVSQ